MGMGEDNPEFRNMDEYLGALSRLGAYAEQNPQMIAQYVNTPEGKQHLERLGYTDPNTFLQDAKSGKFRPKDYINPKEYGKMGDEIGNYYDKLDNTLSSYEKSMKGLDGNLTPYGEQFNFSMRDISEVPDQAYDQMLEMQNEQAARGFKGALSKLGNQYNARGFKSGSGFEQAAGTNLGRGYLEQLANLSRDVGMQRAQSKLDASKFMNQQDLYKQQMQAGENQARNAYLTDLQKYAKNFGMQKYGQLTNMATNRGNVKSQGQQQVAGYKGMQSQGAYAPYQMGQGYYNATSTVKGPEDKNIFETIAGGIGAIGGGIGAVAGGFNDD